MPRRGKGEGSIFQREGGGPSPLLNLKPWEADQLTSSLDFSPCHYPHLNPVWFETMELHPEDPVQWASLHFAEAELGDARRVKRAEGMAVAMLRAPGESLPRLFMHPREVKAAYRFLDNPHVDPEGLHAGYRQRVRGAMQAPGTCLRIEDSSEFSYSGRQPVGGLGFIGNAREGLQGFVLHSVLAVRGWGKTDTEKRKRPGVEVLGWRGKATACA
ncbi:MAG: hypothetical protein KatS3mg072_2972 [Meiothermus sp.]|nr:MAG: hypothetical protein KatS3mg072_2972 [Meiothermus sp.]